MISQKSIDEVLETANVKEVLDEFVQLKRRGSNYLGLCPFHNEKTPSFSVSPSKNIYKCFGCGRAGDSVSFLIEHEQMNFPEAIKYLAEKYHIQLEETQKTEEEVREALEKESLHILNQFAADFYKDQLWNSNRGQSLALSYLKERGFLESTIKKFEIGYAPSSGLALKEAALAKGYTEEQLIKIGLLSKRETDFFRERIIFPIHHFAGKVIAFAGRIMASNAKAPKYINSPETEVYHKSDTLYGMFQARKSIRKEDKCLLVEGYTDVISLNQAGVENVVATSGTALTVGQSRLLKRYTRNITLLYDGDKAGINAATRGLEILLEQDIDVRICVLPDQNDPDTFIQKKGITAFKTYLQEEEKDFILFKAGLLSAEAKEDPIQKSTLIKDIVVSIAKVPDTLKRAIYLQQCSQMFQISEHILINELNNALRNKAWQQRKEDSIKERRLAKENQPQELPPTDIPNKPAESMYQEKDVVRILINSGQRVVDEESNITLAEYMIESLKEILDEFEHPIYQEIIQIYKTGIDANKLPDMPFFLRHPNEDIRNMAIELATSPYELSENWEKRWEITLQTQKMPEENYIKDSYQSLLRFKLFKINQMAEENAEIIRKYSMDDEHPEELERHLAIQQELMDTRRKIASDLNTVVL